MFRPQVVNFLSPSPHAQGAVYPWYDTTYTDLAVLPPSSLGVDAQLGNLWHTEGPFAAAGGNAFMVVKAAAGLTAGMVLASAANTTGTVTAAGSTVAVINTNITTTINEADNFIYFQDLQALRRIVSSTIGANAAFTVSTRDYTVASLPFDPNQLASVPANGSAVIIYRPFSMIPCTAVLTPKAVAMQTMTSGNMGVVQVMGLGLVQANNVGAAVVSGVPGVLQAGGILTGTATPQYLGPTLTPLLAYNSATTILIPASFNFLGVL